ncbi:MAG: cytochrome c biogenesis protein CcdA [Acetivibrio sp.]
MQYFISFLEGIITFISPCLLPMLPLYISYFAGGEENHSQKQVIKNALGFVLGFTLLFVSMGAFAGTIGSFLKNHQTMVNVVSGMLVIFFGLNFLGVFKFNLFHGIKTGKESKPLGFLSSLVFGIAFSIGWTPCVGAFLGSALLLASQQGSVQVGILMLLSYSLGLGIPFFIRALLIDKLKSTFQFIKKNYHRINLLSGCLLVLIGCLMLTGTMNYFLALLTF